MDLWGKKHVLVIFSFMDLAPCHWYATSAPWTHFVWRTRCVRYEILTQRAVEVTFFILGVLEEGKLSETGLEVRWVNIN